ncbi:hypothetical protein [Pusillimonas sp. ANT_WB101]|uniref:hypothetical protein n=1 Tax=Pusillimonas sp. ANT_WB101 TaxID=2597356 RepID=UPI00165D32D2|nr:hypothetical protein [Pusillimonas sp. ANT_WB101]
MAKRNLFAELIEGFEALKNSRENRVTLRQHIVEADYNHCNGTESFTTEKKKRAAKTTAR